MQRRTHVIFGSVLLLALIWWLVSDHGSGPVAPDAAGVAAEEPGQPPTVTEAESQRQFAVLEKDKQAYAAEISRRDADQQQRALAATKTVEYRKELQYARSESWTRLISTNWAAYQKLRALAAADPHGTTPCTICNGRGLMDVCFLCGNSGKCPTCFGTGKISGDKLCPACIGTGKCFLCGGTGKMICPFCDDGLVYSTMPPPPQMLPIRY